MCCSSVCAFPESWRVCVTTSTIQNLLPRKTSFFNLERQKASTLIRGGFHALLHKPSHEEVHTARSSWTVPKRVRKRSQKLICFSPKLMCFVFKRASGYECKGMRETCRAARVYVAVCCSVLQCVAVCCSVLQCVAVCCSMLH